MYVHPTIAVATYFLLGTTASTYGAVLRGGQDEKHNEGGSRATNHELMIAELAGPVAMKHVRSPPSGTEDSGGRQLQTCSDAVQIANACVENKLPWNSGCIGCLLYAQDEIYDFGKKETVTCSEYEYGMCQALAYECSSNCGVCADELETVVHCNASQNSNGACSVDCS